MPHAGDAPSRRTPTAGPTPPQSPAGSATTPSCIPRPHQAARAEEQDQHHHQHRAQGGERSRLRRIEVITGQERRRRWSLEEKAKITAESLEPGAKVAVVARRHGVSLGLLHSWRRDARGSLLSEPVRFVPVVTKAIAAHLPCITQMIVSPSLASRPGGIWRKRLIGESRH
ncbi:MAG: hypothetical protein B7Z80_24400 [Rhodospirillales bacterium 20-64-7]|nr:MAG: hypothetical protein B7Z80_24400 [Rhodospirillales bacterium 20-64-7]